MNEGPLGGRSQVTCNLTLDECLGYLTPFQAILKELGKNVEIRFA